MAKPTFIIDTREQSPYLFPGEKTIRTALKTGDYSILGLEDRIAVERKSFQDFVGTFYSSVINGQDRFYKELERAQELDQFCIVVEADIPAIQKIRQFDHGNHANVHGHTVLGWIIKLAQDYGITVYTCTNFYYGQLLTKFFLKRYWRQHKEELNDDDNDAGRIKTGVPLWRADTEGNHIEDFSGTQQRRWNEVDSR